MEGDVNRVEKKREGYFEGKLSKCFLSYIIRAVKLLSLAGRRKCRKKRCRISLVLRRAHHSAHCLDVGKLVPYVESSRINDSRNRI